MYSSNRRFLSRRRRAGDEGGEDSSSSDEEPPLYSHPAFCRFGVDYSLASVQELNHFEGMTYTGMPWEEGDDPMERWTLPADPAGKPWKNDSGFPVRLSDFCTQNRNDLGTFIEESELDKTPEDLVTLTHAGNATFTLTLVLDVDVDQMVLNNARYAEFMPEREKQAMQAIWNGTTHESETSGDAADTVVRNLRTNVYVQVVPDPDGVMRLSLRTAWCAENPNNPGNFNSDYTEVSNRSTLQLNDDGLPVSFFQPRYVSRGLVVAARGWLMKVLPAGVDEATIKDELRNGSDGRSLWARMFTHMILSSRRPKSWNRKLSEWALVGRVRLREHVPGFDSSSSRGPSVHVEIQEAANLFWYVPRQPITDKTGGPRALAKVRYTFASANAVTDFMSSLSSPQYRAWFRDRPPRSLIDSDSLLVRCARRAGELLADVGSDSDE